jgi:hypothetical protein
MIKLIKFHNKTLSNADKFNQARDLISPSDCLLDKELLRDLLR